jgi:hypothetical protein
MPASNSSNIFRYLEEVTPGTIGSGGPQVYRTTDGTISQTIESIEDNELRNDRGKGDTTLVSGSVGGALNINWSHKTHDDFLESLLADEYVEVGTNGIATVTDMAFDTTTHTISSATNDLPLIEKGQWFQISGANESDNNGTYKASDSTAPTTGAIVVDTNVKDVQVTDTAASTEISSARLKQGNDTPRSWTIEKEIGDINYYLTWPACYISSLSLNYAIGSRLEGNFGIMAQSPEQQNTSSQFPGIGSEVAATTTPAFSTVLNTYLLIDGVSLGDSCVESFTLDISANTRERRCLGGGLAASSIAFDPFSITGSATVYLGTPSFPIYEKKLTDLPLTFVVTVQDPLGNVMAVTIPRTKVQSAEIPGGGLGSDIMMNVSFGATTDPDFETMIMFDRLGSVA